MQDIYFSSKNLGILKQLAESKIQSVTGALTSPLEDEFVFAVMKRAWENADQIQAGEPMKEYIIKINTSVLETILSAASAASAVATHPKRRRKVTTIVQESNTNTNTNTQIQKQKHNAKSVHFSSPPELKLNPKPKRRLTPKPKRKSKSEPESELNRPKQLHSDLRSSVERGAAPPTLEELIPISPSQQPQSQQSNSPTHTLVDQFSFSDSDSGDSDSDSNGSEFEQNNSGLSSGLGNNSILTMDRMKQIMLRQFDNDNNGSGSDNDNDFEVKLHHSDFSNLAQNPFPVPVPVPISPKYTYTHIYSNQIKEIPDSKSNYSIPFPASSNSDSHSYSRSNSRSNFRSVKVALVNAQFPMSEYTFTKSNSWIKFSEVEGKELVASIPIGYTRSIETILAQLEESMNEVGSSKYTCSTNPFTLQITIVSEPGTDAKVHEFHLNGDGLATLLGFKAGKMYTSSLEHTSVFPYSFSLLESHKNIVQVYINKTMVSKCVLTEKNSNITFGSGPEPLEFTEIFIPTTEGEDSEGTPEDLLVELKNNMNQYCNFQGQDHSFTLIFN